MKTSLKLAAIALVLAGLAANGAAEKKKSPSYSCYRNIYNSSSSPWTFQANASSGNVYFLGTSCQQNGPCTLPAGSTTGIQYTTTGGFSGGTMSITDNQGQSKSFQYASSMAQCPYIQHSGNTGAVSVNDPANGDWNAWAANWNSGAKQAWPKHRAIPKKR